MIFLLIYFTSATFFIALMLVVMNEQSKARLWIKTKLSKSGTHRQ